MPPGPAFKNRPVAGPSLPSDGTDAVFARLAALLRGSIALRGVTIRAWDEPGVDQSPPGTSGPPWVRLTPSPGPSAPYCRGPSGLVHRMPMDVAIETSVPGGDVAQSQRLWGAILRAIFPGSVMDAQLQYLGVSRVAIKRPAWGTPPMGVDGPSDRCEAAGSVELLLSFTTPE